MPYDTTYHDDGTMRKVFDALQEAGIDDELSINAVVLMQNKGILFRQSSKDRVITLGGPVGERSEESRESNRQSSGH